MDTHIHSPTCGLFIWTHSYSSPYTCNSSYSHQPLPNTHKHMRQNLGRLSVHWLWDYLKRGEAKASCATSDWCIKEEQGSSLTREPISSAEPSSITVSSFEFWFTDLRSSACLPVKAMRQAGLCGLDDTEGQGIVFLVLLKTKSESTKILTLVEEWRSSFPMSGRFGCLYNALGKQNVSSVFASFPNS